MTGSAQSAVGSAVGAGLSNPLPLTRIRLFLEGQDFGKSSKHTKEEALGALVVPFAMKSTVSTLTRAVGIPWIPEGSYTHFMTILTRQFGLL